MKRAMAGLGWAVLLVGWLSPAGAGEIGRSIYVPDNLAPGEKLRGIWLFHVMPTAAQYFDEPCMRDFANRAKFILSDVSDRASLAGAIPGHPEIPYLPVVRMGHSANGTSAYTVTLSEPLGLAAIGHNHPIGAEASGALPVMVNAADADFPWPPSRVWTIFEQVTKAVADGRFWSCDMGHGASHMGRDPEELRFLTCWIEDIAALRIPDPLPSGAFSLRPVDPSKTWLCKAELLQRAQADYGNTGDGSLGAVPDVFLNVQKAAYSSVSSRAATAGAGYVWMPSERVADMWINLLKTGTIEGKTAVRQTNAWHALGDDVGTYGSMPYTGWHCASYRIQNVPGMTPTDYLKLTWSVSAGSLPPGMTLSKYGAITQCNVTQAGIYQFTLKAVSKGTSCEQVHYLPIRAGSGADPDIAITEPANLSLVTTFPLALKWTSSEALGYLRCHSSLDGDISEEAKSLGTSGTITINALRPGENVITLLGYSSAPVQRNARTVVLKVGGVAVAPGRTVRPLPAAQRGPVRSTLLPAGTPVYDFRGRCVRAPNAHGGLSMMPRGLYGVSEGRGGAVRVVGGSPR